jgi:hypothetical protein
MWRHGVFVLLVSLLGMVGGGSFAAGISPELTEPVLLRERSILAESFVTQRLWVWQNRLKLADWNIRVKMVRTPELKPKTLGNIHWDTQAKTATIRVLDVYDYRLPYPEMLQDMEFTVVHELIHLQLASLPRSEASRSAEERAVNHIAEALIQLERKH